MKPRKILFLSASAALAVTVALVSVGAPSVPAAPVAAATSAPETNGADTVIDVATAPPEPALLTCEAATARIAEALAKPDGAFADDALTDLVNLGRDAVEARTRDGAECTDAVVRALEGAPACARAYGAVSAGVLSMTSFPTSRAAALVARSTGRCRAKLIESVQLGAHVDKTIVDVVEGQTRAAVGEERQVAWMALGTLERKARAGARPNLATRIDGVLARALEKSRGMERVTLLEAAGNAACEGCLPLVRRAAESAAWDVRRSAVSALRFHESEEAVHAMCAATVRDVDAPVREQAAWSLRWKATFEEPRVTCLVLAAVKDDSTLVRRAAALSLATLGPRSPLARSALRHLTTDGYPEDVREIALGWLMGSEGAEFAGEEPLFPLPAP
jgi:hypothetical protein